MNIMKPFTIFVAVVVGVLSARVGLGGEDTTIKERTLPEYYIFFLHVEEEMANYKQYYGYYPKEWYRLDFPFACGLVAWDDPADYPKKEYGDTWHPNRCKYTYIITKADETTYEIRTENDLGLANYIFKLGDDLTRFNPIRSDDPARSTLIE